ncbi:MAG TPA: hydroxysqualene dehydroxylase HpnE [Candidatus Dormibacteraeota bacterium]|nr:hydroxysqualene dehydroxylase HpnE [Candidatus Dormibacteraeota bacterium]
MARRSVAVVGGGLAGLAAGLELSDAGYEVELFERSRLLGGRATSFEIDGVEVDNGQHVFLGCCSDFQSFVGRAGMGDRLALQERFDALVVTRDGTSRLRAARLPAPWHLLASFARFGALGIRSKIDVARALAAAARNGDARNETFAQWLRRRKQSDEAIRVFWTPFFVPALNVALDEMDASEALFTLRTAFLGDAGAARFGFSTVPLAHIADAAAARVARVHRSTSVASLETNADATRLEGLVTTSGERREFDAFVLALTPPQLHRLLREPARYGVPPLEVFTPHPIVDVHLRYASPHPERVEGFDFAALVDSPVQWVFRKGEGYLCCSMSAADAHYRRSSEDVIRLAWDEVQAIPAMRGARLERGAVTRNPEATFSAPPDAVRPGPETSLANLALAGSWTRTGWPDTMESAVRSGFAAARRIMTG